MDEAESAKNIIEEEQRRKRKLLEDGQMTWKPMFFEEVKHPHITPSTFKVVSMPNPTLWVLKETKGDYKSYWDRREEGDWKGMPDLWNTGGRA